MGEKKENEVMAILVVPRTERFYDYYLNGEKDRRTMLRNEINTFCNELCPSCSSEIDRCIFEMRPFILYPQSNEINELKENPPPKINHRKLLFPTSIEAEKKKALLSRQDKNIAENIAKNFSIWETAVFPQGNEKKYKNIRMPLS